jgi:hypothetical protein
VKICAIRGKKNLLNLPNLREKILSQIWQIVQIKKSVLNLRFALGIPVISV